MSDPSASETDDYAGKELTIHDNRFMCSYAGFCTEHSPNVFSLKTEPWINPDGDPAAKTIETIKMCPSGALSYTLNNILHRDQVRAPCIHVACPLSAEHYTLRRYGASKNKPFCDG